MKKISLFLKIALRNLLRNKVRSLITILMIASGLGGIMFLRGFTDGAYQQAIENFTSTYTGHLQIARQGFSQTMDPGLLMTRREIEGIAADLKGRANIKSVSSRIFTQGLASTATASQGIVLSGISPADELKVSRLGHFVKDGSFLNEGDDGEIILGRELAKILKVSLGEKIVVFTQSYYGSLEAASFRIKGFIESGGRDIDRYGGFITLDAARKLLNYPEGAVSSLIAVFRDIKYVPMASEGLKKKLGPAGLGYGKPNHGLLASGLEVKTWDELGPEMKDWISFYDAIIEIIMIVLLIVVAVGIMNTVLMGVIERTYEFGLMQAMGTRRTQIVGMVFSEACILAVLGILAGIILGGLSIKYFHGAGINLSWYAQVRTQFYLGQYVYPVLSWKFFLKTTVFLFIDTLVISIYPAYKAGFLEPIQAIRYGQR